MFFIFNFNLVEKCGYVRTLCPSLFCFLSLGSKAKAKVTTITRLTLIFFQSQRLMVSTIDVNAVGLGADILYQSYFVCLKETSESTVIEYGKTQGTTENGDVYLTMIDRDDPLFVRFYSFGNGEEPLEVVDAHIISRHLTKANCKGGTGLDNQTNMCVQHCHILCDPTQGKKL